MSKKDRMLSIILATLILNTNAVTLSAFADADDSTEIASFVAQSETASAVHSDATAETDCNISEDAVSVQDADVLFDERLDTAVSSPEDEIENISVHTWGAWKTSQAATVRSKGLKNHTCSVCQKVETLQTAQESIRIFGQNRYDTSISIAEQIKKENGGKAFDCVIISCGTNFADALSASYLAKVKNAPILIVGPGNEEKVLEYVYNSSSSTVQVYIVGGTGAVSENVEKSLAAKYKGKDQVKRLWGSNRFQTNIEVLKEAGKFETSLDSELLVASGMNYADALSASAVGKPILLTPGKSLTDEQNTYLSQTTHSNATIIGGAGAVSSEIEKNVKQHIAKIDRLNGANRFETSTLVANKYFSQPKTMVVAYGLNFPDGLCGGPLALAYSSPLILVANTSTDYAHAYAQAPAGNKENMLTNTVALGGETLISQEALKKIITDDMISSFTPTTSFEPGAIENQPTDWEGIPNAMASFEIKAVGENLSYQWQISADGKTWTVVKDQTSSKLSVKAEMNINGTFYRCVVSTLCGEQFVSEPAKMTVRPITISVQPEDWSGPMDSYAYFYVHTDSNSVSYLWQYSSDSGKTWTDTDQRTEECVVRVNSQNNGRLHRCVITDRLTGESVITSAAKLVINENLEITKQPENKTGESGSVQKIMVQAGGIGVKYQWQTSDDGETDWIDVTDNETANSPCLALDLTPETSGKYYRCVITDGSGKSINTKAVSIVLNETGFVEHNGKIYYLREDHKAVTGFQKIDGKLYCFSDKGEMLKGINKVGDDLYCFDSVTGVLRTGLVTNDTETYLFGEDGKALGGWYTAENGDKYYFSYTDHKAVKGVQTIDGMEYFFASNCVMQTGVVLYPDGVYHYMCDGEQVTGFVKFNGATYYVLEDSVVLTGLQTIDGDTYYFGRFGYMLTGGYLIDGKRYYFDVETGKAIHGFLTREDGNTYCYDGGNGVKRGLVEENGKLYYTDDEGIMRYGRRKVGDKYYYFDDTTGEAISGWRELITSSGTTYSCYYSPTDYAAVTGLQKIDGEYYLFNDNGYRQHGVKTVDDKTYLFDAATGKMQTGWYISSSGYTYYYDGINGRIAGNRCVSIDGKYYFFNDSGVLCSGIRTTSEGKKLFFDAESYEPLTGFASINGKNYYNDGLKGLKSGNVTIDGNEYLFSTSSYVRLKGAQAVNDVPCWFDENTGIRVTGFQYNSSNDRYYLYNNNGRNTGFNEYGGVLYNFNQYGIPSKGAYSETSNPEGFKVYFDPTTGEQQLGLITYTASSGKAYTFYYLEKGCITKNLDTITQSLDEFKAADGWHELEGLVYYVQNGGFVKGLSRVEDNTYYFSELSGAMLKGLRRIGSDYYLFSDRDGRMLTGWQTVEGKQMYFDTVSGKMLTGLQTIDEKTYCLLQGSGFATGTVQIGEDTYEFAPDGSGTKVIPEKNDKPSPPENADSWVTEYGNKSYFAHDGEKLTDLQIIGQKLYLFDDNGKMLTGLQEHNGILRCYTDDGVLLGLQNIDGELYFFDNFGAALRDKVKVIDGKTYYFTKDGYAATGFCYVPEYYCTFYFDPDHTAHIGWLELGGKKYYYYPEASFFVPGTPAHGLTYVDGGKMAYFDYETACQQTGLVQVGLNKYMYFDEKTGYAVSGFKNCNGSLYLFSDEAESFGVSLSGLKTLGNSTYYFDDDTQKAVSGLVTVGTRTYYFDTDFKMAKGMCNIDGSLYYFHPDSGYMRSGVFTINGSVYCFGEDGAAISGWYITDAGDKYYFSNDDHKAYTGMHIIDGKKYFFETNGKSKTGLIKDADGQYHYLVNEGQSSGFIEIKGNTYYVDENSCVLTDLQKIDGYTYYFSTSGVMQRGFYVVDNKRYFFDYDTGRAVTGFIQRENGYTYYFDGSNGVKTGLQKINGKTYYLNENGIVYFGRQKINDAYYFFDNQTGEACTGWRSFAFSTGEWYTGYFSTSDLKASSGGLKSISGKYYYFSDTGYALSGKRKVNNVTLYFDPVTFELYTGYVTINGKVYYSDGLKGITLDKTAKAPENANTWGTIKGKKCYYGTDGKLVKGLKIIDKKLYIFDDDGAIMIGLIRYDGVLRLFTENGAVTGIQKTGNETCYFSPSDGSAITGLKVVSDIKYYLDAYGKSYTGWITLNLGQRCYFDSKQGLLTGLQLIDGKTYWFGTNGIMRTGVVTVTDKNGKQMICCFDNSGAMVHGLTNRAGELYYYDDTTGERITGWKTVNGNTYYFNDSTGAALKGKRVINNYNYYFDLETAVRKLGVIKVGNYFYCFSDQTTNGLMYGLTEIDGELYYFNEPTGASQLGFLNLNDTYFYFSSETGASVEGIQWVSQDYALYFNKTGGIKKGLLTYKGKRYYCYPSTGKVTIGLVSIGDKLFCFDDNGAMMKNATVEICGITYVVDDYGYVTVEGNSKLKKMIRSGIEKLGTPYLEECSALDDSIDPTISYNCSRFVTKELSDVGIFVRSIAFKQYHLLTHSSQYEVVELQPYDELKPGDIIYQIMQYCYDNHTCSYWCHIHHVMIYLGNEKVLHCNYNSDMGISGVMVQDNVSNLYNKAFTYKIIRLIEITQ